jgi:hypothetical protein
VSPRESSRSAPHASRPRRTLSTSSIARAGLLVRIKLAYAGGVQLCPACSRHILGDVATCCFCAAPLRSAPMIPALVLGAMLGVGLTACSERPVEETLATASDSDGSDTGTSTSQSTTQTTQEPITSSGTGTLSDTADPTATATSTSTSTSTGNPTASDTATDGPETTTGDTEGTTTLDTEGTTTLDTTTTTTGDTEGTTTLDTEGTTTTSTGTDTDSSTGDTWDTLPLPYGAPPAQNDDIN